MVIGKILSFPFLSSIVIGSSLTLDDCDGSKDVSILSNSLLTAIGLENIYIKPANKITKTIVNINIVLILQPQKSKNQKEMENKSLNRLKSLSYLLNFDPKRKQSSYNS